MKALFASLLTLIAIFTPLNASCAHILVVYRQDIKAYQNLVEKFKSYGKDKFNFIECQLNNTCSVNNNSFDFVVALGDSAVRYSHKFKKPLIAFFVTDYSLAYSCPSQRCLYYFLFPDAKQILAELSKIFPSKTNVAILCSSNSISWVKSVKNIPLKVSVETVSSSEILDNLRKIFRKNYQVIILAPDLIFLQKKVLREIIKLSYTSKKLVVGFSAQMLELGLPLVITYDYDQIYSIIPQAIESFEKQKYISFPISILVNGEVIDIFPIDTKTIYENNSRKVQ